MCDAYIGLKLCDVIWFRNKKHCIYAANGVLQTLKTPSYSDKQCDELKEITVILTIKDEMVERRIE